MNRLRSTPLTSDTAFERSDRFAVYCIPIGSILTALGAAVILGWLLKVPTLVRLMPDYAPMVPNTAVGFVLLGAALAIPQAVVWRARVQASAGAAVALLAALVLTQDLFAVDLGVDYLFSGAWLEDPRPHPTRMAPNTAIAFVLAGAVLIATNVARRGVLLYLAELAVLAVVLIALLAACAYAFSIDFLLGWYPYQRMALHTALGFLLLGAGLWLNLRHSRLFREQVLLKEDLRILHAGAVILILTAVASGVITFVAFERQIEGTLRRGLELLQHNRVDTFRADIDQGMLAAEAITTRPALRRELDRLRTTHGQPDMAFLDRVAKNILQVGFSAVALHDHRGRTLVRAGRFASAPALRVRLNHPPGAELLWADGLVLRVQLTAIEGGKPLGTIVAERRLTRIERLFQDIRGLGETGEMAVCAARGDGMVCLPTRLKPEVFVLERRMHGQLLPMSRALDGFTGVVAALDYRGQRVIAAHGPIPLTGLGLVVKVDADELYRSLIAGSRYGLPLVAALLGAGLWLLQRQVRPLALQLMQSQQQVRELSLTDELTGLRNRRGFVTLAEAELALARRMQRPLLLLYADLDGLKDINDTLGHGEGDRALRDVAAVLRRTFRDADILSRLGGDEFAVLAFGDAHDSRDGGGRAASGTTAEGGASPAPRGSASGARGNSEDNAGTIVGRLQANMDELNHTAGRPYRLVLSVGVVRCDPSSRLPLDDLLAQADTEMYRVKQAHRAARKN